MSVRAHDFSIVFRVTDITRTVRDGGAGSVSWSSATDGMWHGFASIFTDACHESLGASWRHNYPEAIANRRYHAVRDDVLKGKTITQGDYGRNISYSQYRGGSTGGKQRFKEVEMFNRLADELIKQCDARDGVKDGTGCIFMTEKVHYAAIVTNTTNLFEQRSDQNPKRTMR
ncbi:feruloyl esterase B precursor protein [Rutstroemia sp. NJR-2017a BBW]|nr:feruloyl esterase B precursor protein [Rutstroemia sp. NJR-2017a BBW]